MPELFIIYQDLTKPRLMFLDQESLSNTLGNIPDVEYQVINVESSLTPNDIIQTKLGLPLEKKERIPTQRWLGDFSSKIKCTLITRYQLTCPMLSFPLQENTSIGQQGIIDRTVFVLKRDTDTIYDRLEDDPDYEVCHSTIPIRSARHFNQMVKTKLSDIRSGNQDFYSFLVSYTGVILYTDEDVELAKYVRENYMALDQMSENGCDVLVIERSPKAKLSEIVNYWSEILAYNAYIFWGGDGMIKTKPYDKSAAYEIAKQMGVFAYQLPCIIFFDEIADKDKIVIPIRTNNFSDFFRLLFGSLQEISTKQANQANRKRLLTEIKEHLVSQCKQTDTDKEKTTYIFHGKTVFINHPTGNIALNDFQND